MVNIDKVVLELHELMADPMQRATAKALLDRIESGSLVGKVTMHLLDCAENGNFR